MAKTPPPRPVKNTNVFISDKNATVFAPGIFEGQMGDLPVLMSVNVGYYPGDPDPYMYHYESEEVMFAYKKDAQKRVLIQDAFGRTLSLPLRSSLKFRVGADNSDMTMAQVVSSHSLPVPVRFARTDCMEFKVDRGLVNHKFFGPLTVTTVYEEPYLWCLSIGNGKVAETPIVLPRNLLSVCFCPVIAIQGAEDPAAKVKEFVDMYTDMANNLKYNGDPFFQDLAFVSRGPEPVEKVEPYIDNTTFIPIHFKYKPLPELPSKEAPWLPPRTRLSHTSLSEEMGPGETPQYSTLADTNTEQHIYSEIHAQDVKLKTDVVTPSKKPLTGAESYTEDVEKPSRRESREKVSGLPDKSNVARPLQKPSTAAKTSSEDAGKCPQLPGRKNSADGSSGDIHTPRRRSVDLMAPPVLPPLVVKAHLKDLTVEDVAHKLKELGLEKYAKKFRKHRIDGVLLQKLTEEHIMGEFKMNHTEFLLLHTFITEAHIPQTSSSKSGGKGVSQRHNP